MPVPDRPKRPARPTRASRMPAPPSLQTGSHQAAGLPHITPLAPGVSVKPSDRPMQQALVPMRNRLNVAPLGALPKISPKPTGHTKGVTRPKTGMK